MLDIRVLMISIPITTRVTANVFVRIDFSVEFVANTRNKMQRVSSIKPVQ